MSPSGGEDAFGAAKKCLVFPGLLTLRGDMVGPSISPHCQPPSCAQSGERWAARIAAAICGDVA